MSTDEAVPAQAFWQAGSTSQALPLQGMASPLPVHCSPGSARRTSFASPSPHWKITSLHDQLRRAHRTDAECDDRDRGHREHWQRGIGKGTVWSKGADIEWCHIQLQRRANNVATCRQRSTSTKKKANKSICFAIVSYRVLLFCIISEEGTQILKK